MKPKLTQEQRLSWKMTTQLYQAIEMLQYTSYQFVHFLQEQEKENPFIEIETNFDQVNKIPSQGNLSFDDDIYMNTHQSMYDFLKEQLLTMQVAKDIKKIIEFGIDSLDQNGYLTITVEEWAAKQKVSQQEVEEALQVLQSLEPVGIGARNLQECICLQLKRRGRTSSTIEELVNHHIDWIADENYEQIQLTFHLTIEEVKSIFKEIQSCNPKPGSMISVSKPEYVIPDAEVINNMGVWQLTLSPIHRPKISINQEYQHWKMENHDEQKFIEKYIKAGHWLKQAIAQRYENMEKIFTKIVEKQLPFFNYGEDMIGPLTLKDVAKEVNLHVSTISRTIQGKYIQTPHGIFTLKFFFQQAIPTVNGTNISVHTIKSFIKEIVLNEDKKEPLSDQNICQLLREELHIEISRRTVAKYRLELRIPSSTNRKRRSM